MPLILPLGRLAPTIHPGVDRPIKDRVLIFRVLHGRVKPECISIFRGQAAEALERTRRQYGCSFASVGRQAHKDGSEDVVFVTLWTNLNAVYDWVGGVDLLDSPIIAGGRPDVFVSFDIQHYEVLDHFAGELDPALSAAVQG